MSNRHGFPHQLKRVLVRLTPERVPKRAVGASGLAVLCAASLLAFVPPSGQPLAEALAQWLASLGLNGLAGILQQGYQRLLEEGSENDLDRLTQLAAALAPDIARQPHLRQEVGAFLESVDAFTIAGEIAEGNPAVHGWLLFHVYQDVTRYRADFDRIHRKLEEIAAAVQPRQVRDQRLAPALRRKYVTYLRTRHEQADLRGLVPAEHAGLYGARVLLGELYVPLQATVVEYRPSSGRGMGPPKLGRRTDHNPSHGFEAHSRGDSTHSRREHMPLDTLLSKLPVTIILGDPGSGKSTFLKHYALEMLAHSGDEAPLPVMLPLAAYAQALKGRAALAIDTYAAEFYKAQGLAKLETLFAHARRRGRAVYLLDGLDEVPSDMRVQVSNMIVALAHTLGSNRLLVTSRTTAYTHLPLTAYYEATLEPFTEAQIATFVQNWYAAFYERRGLVTDPAKTAAHLLKVISGTQSIARLADNPLTLTMLALLFFAGNADLPRHRVVLYSQVTKTLIGEWHKARNLAGMPIGSNYDELEVRKRVGPLAYWMHEQKPETMATRSEVEHLLARLERQAHPDADLDNVPRVGRFLDELSKEIGILFEKRPGQWAFNHLTFQEYFAAREIARWRQSRVEAEVARRAPDPRWTEVIRLAVAYIGRVSGRTEDATMLVEETILQRNDHYEPYLRRNLLLAGRVLADDPGVEPRAARVIARQVFDLFVETNVDALKASAAALLLELLSTELRAIILPWIEEALESRHIPWGSGQLAADPAVRALLLARLTNVESGACREAVRELAAVANDPAVRDALLPLLAYPGSGMRATVAGSLASAAADPDIHNALLSLLDDPAREVSIAATRSLGRAAPESPMVRTALLALSDDADPWMRAAAVEALESVVADHPAVRTALIPLLADSSWYVSKSAAEVLAQMADDPAIQAVLLPLLSHPEPLARAAAARALDRVAGDATIRAALLPLLDDPEWIVHASAARALGSARLMPPLALIGDYISDNEDADEFIALYFANAPPDPELCELAEDLFTLVDYADIAFAMLARCAEAKNTTPASGES